MMIGPEYYYDKYLKGKSAKEIMSAIRSLKREINRLKNIAEHPEYLCTVHPSEEVRILCNKDYLERAKRALIDAGGEYIPTGAELKAAEVRDNMAYACRVEFSIGGESEGFETGIYTFDGDLLKVEIEDSLGIEPSHITMPEDEVEKADFIDGLTSLDLGEWRRRYDTERFGYSLVDGIAWELSVYFSNGYKPLKICGINAYPYNFGKLMNILNVE